MILNAYFNTLMILQIWKTTPSLAILWYLMNMIMLMKRHSSYLKYDYIKSFAEWEQEVYYDFTKIFQSLFFVLLKWERWQTLIRK